VRSVTLPIALAALAVLAPASMVPTAAQAFKDVKSARVDYSKAEAAPKKPCEGLGMFKGQEIVEVHATPMAAAANVPAHCRVTGVISPEVAFEVSLPTQWNGRFYMIGCPFLAARLISNYQKARNSMRISTRSLSFIASSCTVARPVGVLPRISAP